MRVIWLGLPFQRSSIYSFEGRRFWVIHEARRSIRSSASRPSAWARTQMAPDTHTFCKETIREIARTCSCYDGWLVELLDVAGSKGHPGRPCEGSDIDSSHGALQYELACIALIDRTRSG